MANATLHYYYDPLCGWCYAAAPLITAAASLDGLSLALHAGGMMSGASRQQVSPRLRDYVMPHDRRIHALTGQPFGDAYFNGLLLDETAVFDSTPPTLAMLATQAMGHDPLEMLHLLQRSHYAEGRRIADESVLLALADEMGLDRLAFADAMRQQAGEFAGHVGRSHREMAAHGLRGFPSLLLEKDGVMQQLDISPYLGKPHDFAVYLQSLIGGAPATAESGAAFCTPDGCH